METAICDMLTKGNVVYTFYDADMMPLYVGKTVLFTSRYHDVKYSRKLEKKREKYWHESAYIGFRIYDSREKMDLAEVYWIQKNRRYTLYNVKCRCSVV